MTHPGMLLPTPTAGQGYVGVLFCILRSLSEEIHVKSTERGQHVIAFSTFLHGFESNARSVDLLSTYAHVCWESSETARICIHYQLLLQDKYGETSTSYGLVLLCTIHGHPT